MRTSITEHAYAKLNLTLEVSKRRDDGYHDIVSVMQTVDLYDTLTFSPSDDVILHCDDDQLKGKDDNLALHAARLLKRASGVDYGARIRLKKRIPIAAGLGGGSADAAATLRGLNRLWNLRIAPNRLIRLAASIGADVPFLVNGGTALVDGIGDRVRPLRDMRDVRFVILAPRINAEIDDPKSEATKTGRMFQSLDESMHTSGNLSRKLAARVHGGGDCHPGLMFNVFQQIAADAYAGSPDTAWLSAYRAFASLGASDIMLSGTGPAMFAMAPSREMGTAWVLLLKRRLDCEAYSVGCAPSLAS